MTAWPISHFFFTKTWSKNVVFYFHQSPLRWTEMSVMTVKYIFYDACNSRILWPDTEWTLRTSATSTTAVLPVLWWPSQTSICYSCCWKCDLFWFCPWELQDNFSSRFLPGFHEVHHVWLVEIFQEWVLVSRWDNGGSVAGQVLLPLSRHTWGQKCVSQRKNAKVEWFSFFLFSDFNYVYV